LVPIDRPCALESYHPKDGGNIFLCNVIVNLQSYTLTVARRPPMIGMKICMNVDYALVERMGGGWNCLDNAQWWAEVLVVLTMQVMVSPVLVLVWGSCFYNRVSFIEVLQLTLANLV